MPLTRVAEIALAELEAMGLRRFPRQVSGPQRPRMIVDGKQVLCFCSNNYLGLAGHPLLQSAVREGLEMDGVGSGASRHISGNMEAHRQAEAALASLVQQPAAVLFSTGYTANVGALQALARPGDIVFSDELNHASLVDGARLSRAKVVIYRHADAEDLVSKLASHRHEGKTALIVSESLFSMDGDVAPLCALAELAQRYDAGLVLDEAHLVGVAGPAGAGLAASLGIKPDVTIGTMGKALGAQGAFVAASEPVAELVRNRARTFIFSTAPSPALTRAALAAVRLVLEADELRADLARHAARLRTGLMELGYQVLPGEHAIIPVMVGEPEPTMALSRRLFELGVFVHGVRPPTVPAGRGRLRLVPMASHTQTDIAEALAAFAEARP